MSHLLRAWLLTIVTFAVLSVPIRLVSTANPDGWVLNLVTRVAMVALVAVVGFWYRWYRPAGSVSEYALATVPLPALFLGAGVLLSRSAGVSAGTVLVRIVVNVLVLAAAAAAVWYLSRRPERSGY